MKVNNKKKLSKVKISEDSTIESALKKINSNHLQFCFLTNSRNKIIGIVTDGDIRRAILKKINLKTSVNNIIDNKFNFLYENQIFLENKTKYLEKYGVNHLPILNEKNELVDFITNIKDNTKSILEKTTVMILAGGFGKRLLPLTKSIPKPMIKIKNKPMLELLINKLEYFDLKNIVISTHYKSEIIKNYFKNGNKFRVNIKYTNEKKPLGTAGPLNYFKDSDSENFLVLNSDVYSNLNLLKFISYHQKKRNDLTILCINHNFHIKYGVVRNKGYKVLRIDEKPMIENKILGGVYIMNNKIIKLSSKNFLDMDELINLSIKKKYRVEYFMDDNIFWADLGSLQDLERIQNLDLETI